MDWEDCKWIVRSYMDWKIAGFGTVGIVLPWPPPLCQKCAKKGWEDCIWIVSIVFGLCQLYWIVRVYLDCTNVFGLYDCIWIVLLYLDYIIAGFVLPIPPLLLCQKVEPKIIVSIVVGICRLYLDYVNCIWIVSIVFGFCDFIWIVWLYLDCTIVFWLCRLYLDCAGFGKGGVILPLPPSPCAEKVLPKKDCTCTGM